MHIFSPPYWEVPHNEIHVVRVRFAVCWSRTYASQFSHPHPSPWDFSAHLLPSSCTQHVVQSVVEYPGLRPCSVHEDSSWLVLTLLPVKSVAFWLLWSSSPATPFSPCPYESPFSFLSSHEREGKKILLMFLGILQDILKKTPFHLLRLLFIQAFMTSRIDYFNLFLVVFQIVC